jgi:predicted O-methyltransferase YrrM
MPIAPVLPSFERLVADYQNTGAHNDGLYRQMTEATWSDPMLAEHRRHIERHELGFGDPAFHSMWLRLLAAAVRRFGTVRTLEIGVYKGQVISLWALIAKHCEFDLRISALTPLAGQPMPQSRLLQRLRYHLDRRFREEIDNANFYKDADYEGIIRQLFTHFSLDFSAVTLYRGLSTDRAVLGQLAGETFHVVYIDGDHTYNGVSHDFRAFGPKVPLGGWLVADDASCEIPGTVFWKGHRTVSRATQILPSLGFNNILNVGHNRVYERLAH